MAETKKAISKTGLSAELTNVLILFISFALSLNARRLFSRPPSQTYGVLNISTINPESNYLALLLILICTALLYLGLKKLMKMRTKLFRLAVICLLSLSFLIGVIAPGVARYQDNVDTFHHGEQLAPAVAFEHGKKPYQDLFFLHGAGEDVVTPWLSLKLFGESIGSYYLLTGILQLVTLVVFFLLISNLFKKNIEFLLVSLWFTSTAYDGFYYIRDVFVWMSVALAVSILRGGRWRPHKLAALGFIAGVTLFYSFDRGLFLSILFGLTILALFVFEKRGDTYFLSKQSFMRRISALSYGIFGYAASLVLAFVLLRPAGFSAFVRTTFGQAAKYQGLIFNSPYSKLGPGTFVDWLPVITIIALGIVIFRSLKNGLKAISSQTLVEVVLFIFSIVFFRAATGRPDIGHIAYGTPVLFLLLFMVLFRRLDIFNHTEARLKLAVGISFLPLIIVTIAIFSPVITDYYRLGLMNQAPLKSTKMFLTSAHKPDEYWETEKVETVTKYIQASTNKDDYFFDLSSDPIFYFTTKLQNPTRYSISWFADATPLEQEMLRELKDHPPKVILYESGTYYDRPDFISMKDRLPEVNAWILQNYPNSTYISGAVIRSK